MLARARLSPEPMAWAVTGMVTSAESCDSAQCDVVVSSVAPPLLVRVSPDARLVVVTGLLNCNSIADPPVMKMLPVRDGARFAGTVNVVGWTAVPVSVVGGDAELTAITSPASRTLEVRTT